MLRRMRGGLLHNDGEHEHYRESVQRGFLLPFYGLWGRDDANRQPRRIIFKRGRNIRNCVRVGPVYFVRDGVVLVVQRESVQQRVRRDGRDRLHCMP